MVSVAPPGKVTRFTIRQAKSGGRKRPRVSCHAQTPVAKHCRRGQPLLRDLFRFKVGHDFHPEEVEDARNCAAMSQMVTVCHGQSLVLKIFEAGCGDFRDSPSRSFCVREFRSTTPRNPSKPFTTLWKLKKSMLVVHLLKDLALIAILPS